LYHKTFFLSLNGYYFHLYPYPVFQEQARFFAIVRLEASVVELVPKALKGAIQLPLQRFAAKLSHNISVLLIFQTVLLKGPTADAAHPIGSAWGTLLRNSAH
jgi:hypothetical protein